MPLFVFGGLLLIGLLVVTPYLIVATIQAVVSMVVTMTVSAAFWGCVALFLFFATLGLVLS